MKQIILLVAFILLGVVIALLNKYTRPKNQEKLDAQPNLGPSTDSATESDSPNHQITESAAGEDDEYERPEGCCGAHEVCENESLLASNTKIIYFADEELDEFKDRDAESYTSEEIEMFEEVFFTLRENELVDWLKSLQLRHVPLPPAIKEQALMIIAERRKEPAID
ncbi:MAG: phospholipase [Paludibacteraceae bacterium]|nr:phospholipase [Paludibacteraceae bacterium]